MVSFIFATYNSKLDEIYGTLKSILMQKNVDFEIIVADDCSEEDHFKEIEKCFKENNFTNYKLIKNKKNTGTVSNICNVLEYLNYEYVKFISPGDYFIEEDSLSVWLNAFKSSGKAWSFCDLISYRRDGNKISLDDWITVPHNRFVYRKNMDFCMRWNYIIVHDNIVGAGILSKKEYFVKYISSISNRVKFIEDTIYGLLMYEGHTPYYHDKKTMFYNINMGFSAFERHDNYPLIEKDWNTVRSMIVNESKYSSFTQKVIWRYLESFYLHKKKVTFSQRAFARIYYMLFLLFKIKQKPVSQTLGNDLEKFNVKLKEFTN